MKEPGDLWIPGPFLGAVYCCELFTYSIIGRTRRLDACGSCLSHCAIFLSLRACSVSICSSEARSRAVSIQWGGAAKGAEAKN